MTDVIDKYHALLKASQEMLEVSALAENEVYMKPNEVRRRSMALKQASDRFNDACTTSSEQPASPEAAQLALV